MGAETQHNIPPHTYVGGRYKHTQYSSISRPLAFCAANNTHCNIIIIVLGGAVLTDRSEPVELEALRLSPACPHSVDAVSRGVCRPLAVVITAIICTVFADFLLSESFIDCDVDAATNSPGS